MPRDKVIKTVVIKRPVDCEIPDDGIACVSIFTAEGIIECYCSPHILLGGSANVMRAIVDWQARQSDPIRFRRDPEGE